MQHEQGALAPRPCPSCGTVSAARFCAVCGERFLTDADLDFKHFFVHHLPHEVFHLDGKLFRTLRSLFSRPGEMPSQFVNGRRQPWLSPLRLYLVVFLLHGFLASIGAPTLSLPERAAEIDPTGVVIRLASERNDIDWTNPAYLDQFAKRAYWFSEGGTLLIVVLVALAQQWVLYRYNRRYLEHLALSLSVASFYLSVLVVGDAARLIAGGGQTGLSVQHWRDIVASILLPIYWILGIRRFYSVGVLASVAFGLVVTAFDVLIAISLNVLILIALVKAA